MIINRQTYVAECKTFKEGLTREVVLRNISRFADLEPFTAKGEDWTYRKTGQRTTRKDWDHYIKITVKTKKRMLYLQ